MLPSWRQCRFFVTINGVSYKKVLPYRGAHQFTVRVKKSLPKDVKICLPRREKTPYHVVAKSSYRAQKKAAAVQTSAKIVS